MPEDYPAITSDISYTPASLLHLFNSALAPATTKKMILLKGIYVAGKGTQYAGNFYDTLKEEASDAVLTLVVPALLRNELTSGKMIEFYGYITKRVVLNGGRIEVHANMTQLVQQTISKYSDKDIEAIALQQKKASLGYGDVDSFIKDHIIRETTVRITILIGKTAIIDSDIKHALEEAIGFYDIRFERINLHTESEILQTLHRYNDPAITDLLVLSRGGGENLEVFNSAAIAACCLELRPLFLTAIGHKEDTPLVQKMADKAFITPTALGQYLHRIYNDTVAELQNSKARLVETITVQLSANYDKQVRNLEEKIRSLEELNGKMSGVQHEQIQFLQGQLTDLRVQHQDKDSLLHKLQEMAAEYRAQAEQLKARALSRRAYWAILAAVAILCILLGRACGR